MLGCFFSPIGYHQLISDSLQHILILISFHRYFCPTITKEHVAAGKIQALCRRFLDRQKLERHGRTISSMRNMIRQRKISSPQRVITDDVPFLFRYFGIGLLL